ncbi:MAG: prolipoprotein diacylglyceryl transferase [Chthoniobacteraceae bacterium]|jgi:phosphatidylglycerol:prolipoprotein diacylglycerol transferase
MFVAYYLNTLSPFIWEITPGFGPRWYGFAYVLAFFAGYLVYHWLSKRGYSELPPEKVGDFITWAALFGVLLGGRLGSMIFYNWKEWMHDPLMIFRVWDGGMSSHGGILGLTIFTLWYARRHHLSWTSIGDNLCVVAPIGLFFGRIANFINGELYGRAARGVAWAVQFPKEIYDNSALAARAEALLEHNPTVASFAGKLSLDEAIVIAAHTDDQVREILRGILTPRYPSELIEAALEGVVLFCALWILRTCVKVPRGVITSAFFILYALLRIAGEQFRQPGSDSPFAFAFGFLTYGQLLSLFLIVIGIAFLIWSFRHPKYERAFEGKGN